MPENILLLPAEKKVTSPSAATNSPIDSMPSDEPSKSLVFRI
ncbi:hypothetical protein N9K75_00370 [bacterium]|nr:hypothetical protein [bacterium]